MENTGTFFVIESTSGTNDQSQLTFLADKLISAGHEVAVFNFPRLKQPSGYFVDRYKNDAYGTDGSVGPYTGSLFFALDHYEAANEIRKALADGKVVLANKFIGSVMAEQGSQFSNDEERRGYYIWLDNLEFIMLKIPRPSKNFILRTASADRNTQIYDELCNLYPTDFQRIDTERSGKQLSKSTLNEMLWSAIQPQLPIIKQPPAIEQSLPGNVPSTEPGTVSRRYELKGISLLLATKVMSSGLVDYKNDFSTQKISDIVKSGYFIPESLDETSKSQYTKQMDSLLASFELLIKKQQEQKNSELAEVIKNILPVAIKTDLTVYGSPEDIQNLILNLSDSPLSEARKLAVTLHDMVRAVLPSFMANFKSHSNPKTRANDVTFGNYGQQDETVRLLDYSPRNELDLISEVLYTHSHLSLAEIRKEVNTWNYVKKDKFMTAWLTENSKDSVLNNANYKFDVLCDMIVLENMLETHHKPQLQIQPLTPRYGFDVPKVADEAGVGDLFEQCFDDSLGLHSLLSGVNESDAQYAVLLGHKVRANITLNTPTISYLLVNKPGLENLVRELRLKQMEVHPLIAEYTTKSTGKN